MDFEKQIEGGTPPGFDIRYTVPEDVEHLNAWLSIPQTMQWFPMRDPREIDDSAKRWVSFCRYNCSITATIDGEPAGISTLYLQAYRTLAHQCEFGIIVSDKHRDKKVGTHLLRNLMHLGKKQFNIELLHLQVHAENPAMQLYKRFGFREFGRQTQWCRDRGVYLGRVFMERYL